MDKIEQTLKSPQYAGVAKSLSEIGMFSATDLFSTYAGKRPDLDPWMADAMINRDRNMRLQYLAGLGLNLYQSEAIYADMLMDCPNPAQAQFEGLPCLTYAAGTGTAYLSAGPRSQHPGGVNAVYLDGHVSFLRDQISKFTMSYLVSSKDGQSVSDF